jgi:hypothetical protein
MKFTSYDPEGYYDEMFEAERSTERTNRQTVDGWTAGEPSKRQPPAVGQRWQHNPGP